MAKKVNGIKIYPRYSVGSILSSVLDIIAALAILFATFLMPAFTIGNCSMTGVDFAAVAVDKMIGPGTLVPVVENLHLFNAEQFDLAQAMNNVEACFALGPSCNNFMVSWVSSSFGNYIIYAIGFSCLIVLVFAAFLLLIGLLRLIFGTYPKGSKFLCIFAFIFTFVYVIGIFALSFSTKYIAAEAMSEAIKEYPDGYVIYSSWPYIAWGVLLAAFIAQSWIKTLMIKDKLYVAGARKIKKSKEN